MKKCVVVIPAYKKGEELECAEAASLAQCFKVLGAHDIIFAAPKSLDLAFYKSVAGEDFHAELFDDKFFQSLDGYNSLLLSKCFYERFSNFEFILIHQLDVWVFSDELSYWCAQGYDFIGAPWFDFEKPYAPLREKSGNGGFSLRKVSSCLSVLKARPKVIRGFREIFAKYRKGRAFSNILSVAFFAWKRFCPENHFPHLSKAKELPEDFFYAFYAHKFFKGFTTAPPEIALQFSFEREPKRLYELNGNKLPFGCHNFGRYESEFWEKFIPLPKS